MFPTIQVSNSGRGSVNADIPFVGKENVDYHVNVFRGQGTQLTDVLTCGELRREN